MGGHMRLCLHQWLALLVACFFSVGTAYSAAVPAYNGKMNQAVGGIIQNKQSTWGFAANDPRVSATLSAVSTGLTTVAVGAATGAIGTIGWPALLVGAGVSAVVGGAISLGVDAISKWWFKPDGTIEQPSGVIQSPSGSSLSLYCFGTVCAPTQKQACEGTPTPNTVIGGHTFERDARHSTSGGCELFQRDITAGGDWQSAGLLYTGELTLSPNKCEGINLSPSGGVCPASNWPDEGPATYPTPAAAVAALPDAQTATPLSDEMLAAAANTAWKTMADQGGVPWSASDPITPADVAAWRAENASSVPTIGDMIAPVTTSTGSTVPIAPPGVQSSTGPAVTPGEGEQVDLGPDPNTGAPTLETTPTALQILQPILDLMPDLKNYQVAAQAGTCPTGSFSFFSRTFVFDGHCDMLETNRAIIEAAMLLVFTVLSVFLVLRA